MEVQKEWIETLLRRHERENSIARVISIKPKSALGEGENYTCDIIRAQMEVVLGSGRITSRSVIVKKAPEDVKGTFVREYPLFKNEIEIYSRIFPEMKRLMSDKGDSRGTLWCEYYGHSEKRMLLLEDLKESGYRLADRSEGQDIDHATLTLQALGRFHAMSFVLKQEGTLSPEIFGEYLVISNDKNMKKFITAHFTTLADVIRTTWSSEWIPVAKQLEVANETIAEELEKISKTDVAFQVLNHGDAWTNNMMFKYDLKTNKPISVKFVDLQICHYNSYGWDLMYFLRTSVKRDVMDQHLDVLLNSYRDSVLDSLSLFGVDTGVTPSLEDVKLELFRLKKAALVIDVFTVPIIMAPQTDPWDFAALLNQDHIDVGTNRAIFTNNKYRKLIQHDLKYFTSIDAL